MGMPLNWKPGMQMHFPRYTRYELLDASGQPWGDITLPERMENARGSIVVRGRKPNAWHHAHLSIDAVLVGDHATAKLHWIDIAGRSVPQMQVAVTRGKTAVWRAPERDAAAEHVAVGNEVGIGATLDWSADRTRLDIRDAAGNVRIVMSVDEPGPMEGERFRGMLKALPHVGEQPLVHLLIVDGTLPAGETKQYMTP